MAYDSLSDFLNELQDHGELVRISAEVDPVLEITEITDRVCRGPSGGPALFFENVRGSSLPVLVNLLGSRRRLCRALGAGSFEEIAERLCGLLKPQAPDGWLEKLKLVPQAAQFSKLPPRLVRTGACQQVIKLGRDVDLAELPVLQCWPQEAGRVITCGQVFTKHPGSGERSVGTSPLQVHERNACLLHWHLHDGGYENFLEYRKLGTRMPVAVSLGGDPVIPCLSAAPLPPRTDPCLLGGFLRGAPLDLVKCRTQDLDVPAGAEIVIEGFVDPTEAWQTAGACGERTGFYSLPELFPVLQITAITQRANPIYPATIPGASSREDYWLRKASERICQPLIKMFLPEVVDYNLPRAGASRNLCFVSIRKSYPQQARKVMNAIWSLGPLMFSKLIVVVDEHVDVQNEEQVWFQVGANVHPGRDVVLSEGPTDSLDHAAPVRGVGHKLGIDATRKFPEEGHPRPWPEELVMSRDVQDLVTHRWGQYGLGELPAEN